MLKTHISRRAVALAAAGALVLGLAAPVQATEAADSNMAAAQGGGERAKAPRQKKYCIISEVTGSRMRSKVCKTRAEWKAEGQEIDIK